MPLFDSDGELQVTQGETEITGSGSDRAAILIAGVTATNTASFLSVAESGEIRITGSVGVDQVPPLTIGSFSTNVTGAIKIVASDIVQEITGTVGVTSIASPVNVGNFPAVQTVTGSVVLGEQPIQTTGSVTVNSVGSPVEVEQGIAGTQNEGWFTRITDGTQVLGTGSSAPIFTSGSVHVQNFPPVQTVTGSVILGEQPINVSGSLTIDSIVAPVDQGNAGTQDEGWFVRITDGTEVLGTGSSAPFHITGSVRVDSVSSPTVVSQGQAGAQPEGWFVRISDGTQVLGTGSSAPFHVTGSVRIDSVSSPTVVTQGQAGSQGEGWFTRITDGTQVLGTGSSAPLYITGSALALIPATGSRGKIKIEDGNGTGATATLINDKTDSTQKRLQVEAEFKTGQTVTIVDVSTPDNLFVKKVANTGSTNIVSNGSITPKEFVVTASVTRNIRLTEFRIVYVANSILFDGATLGKGGGPLINGVSISALVNSGSLATLGNITINENLLELNGSTDLFQGGTNDALITSIRFGENTLLVSGTSDKISVLVRDDLTAGVRGILYGQGTLYGIFEDL